MVFEIHSCRSSFICSPGAGWSHEQGSSMLLNKLVDDNNMDIDQEDVKMISALILGERENPKYADKSKGYFQDENFE